MNHAAIDIPPGTRTAYGLFILGVITFPVLILGLILALFSYHFAKTGKQELERNPYHFTQHGRVARQFRRSCWLLALSAIGYVIAITVMMIKEA